MKTKFNDLLHKEEVWLALIVAIVLILVSIISTSLLQDRSEAITRQLADPAGQKSNEQGQVSYNGKILFRTEISSNDIYAYDPEDETVGKVENIAFYEALRKREAFSRDSEWQAITESDSSGQSYLVIRKKTSDWDEVLLSYEGNMYAPVWSPTTNQIAYILEVDNYEIHVYDVDTKRDRLLAREEQPIGHISWSPDGGSILYEKQIDNENEFWVITLKNNKKTKLNLPVEDHQNPIWGKSLAETAPEEQSTLEALLGNIQCLEDESFSVRFLVKNLAEKENAIQKIILSVNGTEVYTSGKIEKNMVSETLNLLFAGVENRDKETWITLQVWDKEDFRVTPLTVKQEGQCSLAENIPGGLLGALPKDSKSQVYAPPQAEEETQKEYGLEDFENKLIFQSDRDGVSTFFMMEPDGSSVERIQGSALGEHQYQVGSENKGFSTQTNQVVFSKKTAEQEEALFIFDLESGWAWQLTTQSGQEKEPIWSPIGDKIAYIAEAGKTAEIAVLDMTTRETILVSPKSEITCGDPTWSPTGKQLAFWCESTQGLRQIWIVDQDGENAIKLSNPPYNEWAPIWVGEAIPLPEDAEE